MEIELPENDELCACVDLENNGEKIEILENYDL